MATIRHPWYTQYPAIFRYSLFDRMSDNALAVAQKTATLSLVSDTLYADSDDLIGLAQVMSASAPDPIFSLVDLVPIFIRYSATSLFLSDSHPLRWPRHTEAASIIFDVFHYLCRTEYPYAVRVPCLDMDEFRDRMVAQDRIAIRVCDDDVVTIHCKNQIDATMVRLHWQTAADTRLPEVE